MPRYCRGWEREVNRRCGVKAGVRRNYREKSLVLREIAAYRSSEPVLASTA